MTKSADSSTNAPEWQYSRILVVGVYLLDVANLAAPLTETLCRGAPCPVDVRWAAAGSAPVPPELAPLTVFTTRERRPKFALVNQLLDDVDLDAYDYLLVTDDDISLGEGFLGLFLESVARHRFSLAQPARTHDSYIDHHFGAQLLGVEARQTRFVEIGPLFCVHRSAYGLLLPFDIEAPMGWGLDQTWPCILEAAGLRLGIVDRAPVTHALRKPVSYYDYSETNDAMAAYLSRHPHLDYHEAMTIVTSFPANGEPPAKGAR